MLPQFDSLGNLPAGIHSSDWQEVTDRFGFNEHRRWLLSGLLRASRALRDAGCSLLYLDGSFTTATPSPRDFDGCWDATGVKLDKLDPVLKTFAHKRALQKAKYFGELFPARARADLAGNIFLTFFQVDKSTGRAKGIVAMSLEGLPT